MLEITSCESSGREIAWLTDNTIFWLLTMSTEPATRFRYALSAMGTMLRSRKTGAKRWISSIPKNLKELNDKLLNISSHDLKKPPLVILEAARELQTEYPLGTPMDAEAQESLSMLIKSGEYMQRVVQDSLDLRAIESGHIKLAKIPTDINELTKQTLERNSEYAKRKNINLSSELDPRLPTIKADNFRLAQVLDNLLGNAIKFSPAGASTVVRTYAEDGFILLEVSDAGPGIAEEDMDKLFVEYAQLRNRATSNEKSTGLVLAICKELIGLHGGEIGARNNPEGGSTFWFRLQVNS